MSTEIWLGDDAAENANALPEFQSFGEIGPSPLGGGCFVYIRNSDLATFFPNPQLHCVQHAKWLRADIGGEIFLMVYAQRPPGSCRNYPPLITEAADHTFTVSGPKLTVGAFSDPVAFCSIFSTPHCLLHFLLAFSREYAYSA